MKRFDSEAIYDRLSKTLQTSVEWANIVGDGTIDSILKSIAEGNAEVARYIEYSLGERKWTTAQNLSSLTAQAELIGYKRRQPVSAIGYVYVSHTDNAGHPRLKNFGSQFFDIDAASDYDNLEKDANATIAEQSALVPWTYSTAYTVPEGTIFKSNSGILYFSTESVRIRTMTEPWTNIKADSTKLQQFYRDGGWNGIKYLKVPVMQGKLVTVQIGRSDGSAWQAFKLADPTCEAALNAVSKKYFYVTVSYNGVDTVYNEVYLLGQVSGRKNVFQKRLLNDGSGLEIKFGNDVCGKIPPEDAIISLTYVQSAGSAGSVSTIGDIHTMIPPATIEDPRPNVSSTTFLTCVNATRIFGGKDAEENDDIKIKAPASYLTSLVVSTLDKYKTAIEEYLPIQLLHFNIYANDTSISSMAIKENVILPQTLTAKSIVLTGVLMTGEAPLASESSTIINTLVESLENVMAVNDSIEWLDPELDRLRLSFDIEYNDLFTAVSDQVEATKNNIMIDYDIFDQTFYEPVYYSDITKIAKSDNVNYADLDIDLLAEVDESSSSLAIYQLTIAQSTFDQAIYTSLDDYSEYCYGIPFSFSSNVMTFDSLKQPDLDNFIWLEVDISYKNITASNYYDRTILLTDTAHYEPLNPDEYAVSLTSSDTYSGKYFYMKNIVVGSESADLNIEDGTESIVEATSARSIRIRQFIKDSSAKTDAKYNEMLTDNSELRRLTQTNSGINAVDSSGNSTIDSRYVSQLTIQKFYYDSYLGLYHGLLIIPQKLLDGLLSDSYAENSVYVASIIKQYLDIKVYARLNPKNIVPTKANQLIYVDTIDINSSVVSYDE